MPIAVLAFSVGAKWVLQNTRMLQAYSGLWIVFSMAMAVAWLIHAGQFEDLVANTWLGQDFGAVTVLITAFLLRLSGVAVNVQGQLLLMPPPSRIDGVLITPLCGGLLSFVMFTVAFGIVLFDVGRRVAKVKLIGIFVLGAFVTLLISILRVYVVLVIGVNWGYAIMMTAHNYLGYVLFLSFVTVFWYLTLRMSRQPIARNKAVLGTSQPRSRQR